VLAELDLLRGAHPRERILVIVGEDFPAARLPAELRALSMPEADAIPFLAQIAMAPQRFRTALRARAETAEPKR